MDGPNSTNEASVEKTFTGQQADSGMGGLMYYNGRYYDPTISRFISADPIITDKYNLQSYNRYAYVMNNPVMLNDPSGYSWLSKSLGLDKANAPDLIRDINKEYHNLQKEFVKNPTLQQAGYFATAACGPYATACAAGYSGWLAKSAGASDLQAFRSATISGITSYSMSSLNAAYLKGSLGGSYRGAIGYVSLSGMVGGFSSFSSGGNFMDGFGFSAATAGANVFYLSWTEGIRADMRMGGEAKAKPSGSEMNNPLSGVKPVHPPEFDNFGFAWQHISEQGPFHEGGWAAKTLSYIIPGGQSISYIHDYWVYHGAWKASWGFNYWNMPPAAAITWGAIIQESGMTRSHFGN